MAKPEDEWQIQKRFVLRRDLSTGKDIPRERMEIRPELAGQKVSAERSDLTLSLQLVRRRRGRFSPVELKGRTWPPGQPTKRTAVNRPKPPKSSARGWTARGGSGAGRNVAAVVLRGAVIVLAAFLAALALDNLLRLPGFVRLALGLAFVAGAVYFLGVKVLHRLTRRLTDEMVAAHVERSHPDLDNYLINAILLQKAEFADPITRRMADLATRRSGARGGFALARRPDRPQGPAQMGADRGRPLPGVRPLRRGASGLLLERAAALRRAAEIHPAGQRDRPDRDARRTRKSSRANRWSWRRAGRRASTPQKAEIAFEDRASGRRETKPMAFEGGCFSYEFAGLQSDFSYRVSAGDFVSDRYAVTVRTRPGVREVKLTYVFPAYMNLPDQAEPPSAIGNITAPIGTRVRIEASADRPIKSARPFRRDDGRRAMDGDADDRLGRTGRPGRNRGRAQRAVSDHRQGRRGRSEPAGGGADRGAAGRPAGGPRDGSREGHHPRTCPRSSPCRRWPRTISRFREWPSSSSAARTRNGRRSGPGRTRRPRAKRRRAWRST